MDSDPNNTCKLSEDDHKETDVDTGVAKRIRSPNKKETDQSTSVSDSEKTASKLINVSRSRTGSNFENNDQDDSSPSTSPPRKKLISALKEKMAEEEGVQRMKLAHEIASNDSFKLPDSTNDSELPPADDTSPEAAKKRMEKAVKDVVQRAFWDCVRAGIESDPPNYEHAFVLLQEIKEILIALLPQNRVTSFHKRIREYMDLELFQQQAQNDTLDVKAIATFVVDFMASICAPIRDDQIATLRSIEDVVDLFKEIHRILDLMKIDLANFAIKSVRPHIQQKQFEYERSQFAKLLQNSPDGLKNTRQWILKTHQEIRADFEKLGKQISTESLQGAEVDEAMEKKKFEEKKKVALSPLCVLKTAYTKLLSPVFELDNLPETLQMDGKRIQTLRLQVDQIVLVSSIMITSCGVFGQPLASHQAFLTKLKDVLMTLTAPSSVKNIVDDLEGVSLQCWKEAKDYVIGKGPEVGRCVTTAKESLLKSKIAALHATHTHPVYNLLNKRTIEYLRTTADIIANHTSTVPPTLSSPPAGVSFVATELISVALQYAKLINLNQTIYGPFYVPILREILDIPKSNGSPTDEVKKFATEKQTQNGAKKKLDMSDPSAVKQDSKSTDRVVEKGKYKVTGSLADLD